MTEGRGRAKDLYDAVLLAEADAARLSPRLLRRVFRRAPDSTAATDALHLDTLARWSVDWDGFRPEHARVRGTAHEWLARLNRALGDISPTAVPP